MTTDNHDYVSIEDLVSNAVPEGEYKIRMTDIESGKSSKKETPYVRFVFEFTFNGETRNSREDNWLSRKAMPMLGRQLFACGVKGVKLPVYNPEFDDAEEFAADMAKELDGLRNKSFIAIASIEEGTDGVKRNRWRLKGTVDGSPISLNQSATSAV